MTGDTLNRAMALLAFVILTGFVGILIAYVPRWDLAIMAMIMLVLAGWDFFHTATGRKSDHH
ncbi:hypothetical protein [Thalassospira lucentensis]|uniref:hypothetical protein n=1 Tax=Thalassospira lucentensis TaxID=168935 RepID=UPI00399D5CFD